MLNNFLIFMRSYFSKEMKGVKAELPGEDVLFVPSNYDLEEDVEIKKSVLRKFVKKEAKDPLNQSTYQNMLESVDRLNRIVRDQEFMRQLSQNVTFHDLETNRVKGFYPLLIAAIVEKF